MNVTEGLLLGAFRHIHGRGTWPGSWTGCQDRGGSGGDDGHARGGAADGHVRMPFAIGTWDMHPGVSVIDVDVNFPQD
jgi:hypothetical protein